MARNQFALERSRKISIAIKGYDAALASKTQRVRNTKRLERQRAQQERSKAQAEAQRRARFEQACSEMADFNSLNESLAKPAAHAALVEAFVVPAQPSSALMH